MVVTVNEDGETRIREPYLISAPLSGRLMRVELEPGDAIKKDQIIAAIDPANPACSTPDPKPRLKLGSTELRPPSRAPKARSKSRMPTPIRQSAISIAIWDAWNAATSPRQLMKMRNT